MLAPGAHTGAEREEEESVVKQEQGPSSPLVCEVWGQKGNKHTGFTIHDILFSLICLVP